MEQNNNRILAYHQAVVLDTEYLAEVTGGGNGQTQYMTGKQSTDQYGHWDAGGDFEWDGGY